MFSKHEIYIPYDSKMAMILTLILIPQHNEKYISRKMADLLMSKKVLINIIMTKLFSQLVHPSLNV